MGQSPPDSLSVDDVTVRRWREDDVALLNEMVISSLEHLRPWMPWVHDEPLSLTDRAEKVTGWVRSWDAAQDFTCAIVDSSGGLLGVCGLHRRTEAGGLEIGYWIRSGRTGEGIATTATRALVQAAFSIDGISFVEIHHDAANVASSRVPEKVGFARVSQRPDTPSTSGEVGIDVTWRLHRHQFVEFL
jgi:ribosomal-protein-serine acetyltransferase